jgi:hypothetical protein
MDIPPSRTHKAALLIKPQAKNGVDVPEPAPVK